MRNRNQLHLIYPVSLKWVLSMAIAMWFGSAVASQYSWRSPVAYGMFVGGITVGLLIRWVQASARKRYSKANPLGGPAKVFEAAASRIRAGENLAEVMDDYGLAWTSASKWKPIIEMLDSADRDWRRMLRPNLEGNEAMLFLVYDIAAERRMLCDEFCDSGGARIVR